MNLDIRHAESAYAKGNAQFLDFKRRFMAQWYGPLARMQVGMLMNTTPQETLNQVPKDALKRLGDAFDLKVDEVEDTNASTEV